MFDPILDWTSQVDTGKNEEMARIAHFVDQRVVEGFSVGDAAELAIGAGGDLDLVKAVVASRKKDMVKTASASGPVPFPRRYADVAPRVESLVASHSPNEVLDILLGPEGSRAGLVALASRQEKDFGQLVKLAQVRDDDPRLIQEIHDVLRPHVEEAIMDTAELVREAAGKAKITKTGDSSFSVERKGEVSRVDLAARTCTCSRFVLGGFGHLGLACEHLVLAADSEGGSGRTSKRIFAQFVDGVRTGLCGRYGGEVKLDFACVAAKCPCMIADEGECIKCSYQGD